MKSSLRIMGVVFSSILLAVSLTACGGGGNGGNGGDGAATYTASGTHTYDLGTGILTLNTTSSDFECEGPEVGTEEILVISITSTTMIWDFGDGEQMTWTRDNGTSDDIVGTWEFSDNETGNSWEGTFESNSSFSVTGQIVQCENGGGLEPLGFPFSTPSHVVRLAAFGIPNWSDTEPHNGTDLVVDENLQSTKIISPTNGTIRSIDVSENPFSNPPNQLLLAVEISVNSEWTVVLVLEPSTVDEQLKTNQIEAVQVEVGQSVVTGDEIADLLIGDLGYPHLHYMLERDGELVCAYKHSSESTKALFESIPKSFESEGFICHGDV